jgi:hypothetical protein
MLQSTDVLTELELRERLASLDEDTARYRMALVEAIHALHRVTRARDQQRIRIRELMGVP